MAATISFYENAFEYLGSTFNMGSDTWKMILLNSSHVFDATDDEYADISANELSTGAGYTSGGLPLGSVTWTLSSGKTVFTFASPTWTAVSGDIGPFTHAAIYNDTSSGDKLLCSIAFGETITVEDGSGFTVQLDATLGLFGIGV